ncbi:MAG: hypothetical protein R3264_11225 [Anaerolineae bacterium]|nr:hypothetical protein [Anaerolineae bacterium]
MDELIKLVSVRTGLSKEKSKLAVEIVLDYLKAKLPAPVAGQIDSYLAGGGTATGLDDMAAGLGGLLGKK